jgi:hypothetical protein
LRRADFNLIAGWADFEFARQESDNTAWVPTPVESHRTPKRREDGKLNIGLLGNFDHYPTFEMSRALMQSSLAEDPLVRIVFAGLNSDVRYRTGGNVAVLGRIDRVERFYESVDCVVAWGQSGSGIKVKVAEGVMAGRMVITSPSGADGFPPALRGYLQVVPSLKAVTRSACLHWIEQWRIDDAIEAFESALKWNVAVERYRRLLETA